MTKNNGPAHHLSGFTGNLYHIQYYITNWQYRGRYKATGGGGWGWLQVVLPGFDNQCPVSRLFSHPAGIPTLLDDLRRLTHTYGGAWMQNNSESTFEYPLWLNTAWRGWHISYAAGHLCCMDPGKNTWWGVWWSHNKGYFDVQPIIQSASVPLFELLFTKDFFTTVCWHSFFARVNKKVC